MVTVNTNIWIWDTFILGSSCTNEQICIWCTFDNSVIVGQITTSAICTDYFLYEKRRHIAFFHITTHMDFRTLLGNKKYTPRKISFSFISISLFFHLKIINAFRYTTHDPKRQDEKRKIERGFQFNNKNQQNSLKAFLFVLSVHEKFSQKCISNRFGLHKSRITNVCHIWISMSIEFCQSLKLRPVFIQEIIILLGLRPGRV